MKHLGVLFICLSVLCSCAFAFSFAVIGDVQGSNDTFRKAIGLMNRDPSLLFAVNTGDLTPYGTEWEYNKYINVMSASKVRFYNLAGNHDDKRGGLERFRKHFGSPYYSWEVEGVRFVSLYNASRKGLGGQQYNWLKKELKANRNKPKIVFMHKPLFDISGSFPDEVMLPASQAQELISLFENNRVSAVFCGHVHGYVSEKRSGITYIISGGGGGRLHLPHFAGGFHHYVKATWKNGRLITEVVKIAAE
ncbi:MAG: metallophosphoesterase [Candidatus Margulisiibacteriota bacterium]